MRHFDFSLTRQKPRPHMRCVVDLETLLIAPLVQAPPVVAMGFRLDGGRRHVVAANDPAFDSVVESLFLDDGIRIVGAGFRFDIACLMAHAAKLGFGVEWAGMLLGACHDDRVTDIILRDQLYRIAQAAMPMKVYQWNLGALAERWKTPTQPNKSDPWRVKWGTLRYAHARDYPADAVKYLHEDLDATDEVYLAQASKEPWLVDQYRQLRASVSLYLMQCWGIRTDPVQSRELYVRTEEELTREAELCRSTYETYVNSKGREVTEPLIREDGTANKKAAEARIVRVFRERGEAAPRGEATEKMLAKDADSLGNVKLDEEACERSKDPVLHAFTRATQAKALLGKAARYSWPVLQPSFLALGATTGRTSCQQGDEPDPGEAYLAHGAQTQNLQRDVVVDCSPCTGKKCKRCGGKGEYSVWGARECMVARRGKVLFDIDYAAMELRTLAQYEMWEYGVSKLAQILNDPKRCAHIELGAAIHVLDETDGMDEEAAELRRLSAITEAYGWKRAEPGSPEAKLLKLIRQLAKGFNFGGPGGSGGLAMVAYCKTGYGVDVTEAQAKKILAFLKVYYPERKRYLADAAKAVSDGYWMRLPDGSRKQVCRATLRYSGFVRGGMGFTDRSNFPFQALAAACAKESMWRVTVEAYAVPSSPAFGARPNNFVHDQLVGEVDEANFRPAVKRIEELWVGGAQEICPDVLILAPAAVCRRFSKSSGDPVFDDAGELQVYEDWLAARDAKKSA